jgi:hypothetical protein
VRILAAPDDPALLDLPWDSPLEEWPPDQLVALPRGISRHVVRFVRLGGRVYAIKEVHEQLAMKEYRLLRRLERLDVPAVQAVGVVTGRVGDDGQELDPALMTRHLTFSLPYRALFSTTLRADTLTRLLDALAVLLVRLHVEGFYWGDCSLSNTLFRRDAGAFAAYLVDAETGEIHSPALSSGQRSYDLDLARTNIAGELLDLAAGGLLHESLDPVDLSDDVVRRYEALWAELTLPNMLEPNERWRVEQRVRRLNELGYDLAELSLDPAEEGRMVLHPKVVDAGHHSRRLLRLTGLDVQENQARRLLGDLDHFSASIGALPEDEEITAHRWLAEVFQPLVAEVPRGLRGKLEPAEIFHEVLEHRWFLSESAGRDVGMRTALRSYIDNVLAFKPDEAAVLGARSGMPTVEHPPPPPPAADLSRSE